MLTNDGLVEAGTNFKNMLVDLILVEDWGVQNPLLATSADITEANYSGYSPVQIDWNANNLVVDSYISESRTIRFQHNGGPDSAICVGLGVLNAQGDLVYVFSIQPFTFANSGDYLDVVATAITTRA